MHSNLSFASLCDDDDFTNTIIKKEKIDATESSINSTTIDSLDSLDALSDSNVFPSSSKETSSSLQSSDSKLEDKKEFISNVPQIDGEIPKVKIESLNNLLEKNDCENTHLDVINENQEDSKLGIIESCESIAINTENAQTIDAIKVKIKTENENDNAVSSECTFDNTFNEELELKEEPMFEENYGETFEKQKPVSLLKIKIEEPVESTDDSTFNKEIEIDKPKNSDINVTSQNTQENQPSISLPSKDPDKNKYPNKEVVSTNMLKSL